MDKFVGLGATGVQALLNVDDWTQKRSAANMQVTSDYNWFWMPTLAPTKNIVRWARWSQSLAITGTLPATQLATGQDAHSVMSTAASNPYALDATVNDFRVPASVGIGAVPPSDIAALLGTPAGAAIPPGPTRVSPTIA